MCGSGSETKVQLMSLFTWMARSTDMSMTCCEEMLEDVLVTSLCVHNYSYLEENLYIRVNIIIELN
jgi:hypothetical protein